MYECILFFFSLIISIILILRQSDARKFFVDFHCDKKQQLRKSEEKKHIIHISTTALKTLYLHYSHKSHLCKTLSSRLLGYIKRDVVYDNYVSLFDEEKSFTDDEYQEELLFVFCFCGGRESFSFVVHIIRSICIGDGVN